MHLSRCTAAIEFSFSIGQYFSSVELCADVYSTHAYVLNFVKTFIERERSNGRNTSVGALLPWVHFPSNDSTLSLHDSQTWRRIYGGGQMLRNELKLTPRKRHRIVKDFLEMLVSI